LTSAQSRSAAVIGRMMLVEQAPCLARWQHRRASDVPCLLTGVAASVFHLMSMLVRLIAICRRLLAAHAGPVPRAVAGTRHDSGRGT
jgi:hypothetical protein